MTNVPNNLQHNLHRRIKKGAPTSGVNRPVPARQVLREQGVWPPIRQSLPQSVIGNPAFDMFGPNTYELSSIMPHNLDQMIGRYKLGKLMVPASALCIPIGFEPQPTFMGMTEPITTEVDEEAAMIAMALGEPPPVACSDEQKREYLANGETLLSNIITAIFKKYGSMGNYYKTNYFNATNVYAISKNVKGRYLCNQQDPYLVFKCKHCGSFNCVDARPPDEGTALFESLKDKEQNGEELTQQERHTLDKRGLDLHFMVPRQFETALLRDHNPFTYVVNSTADLKDKFFCNNCWCDLAYNYIEPEPDQTMLPIEEVYLKHMKGMYQLEELKRMGYTDSYRDMEPTTRSKIIEQDYRLAVKVFTPCTLR